MTDSVIRFSAESVRAIETVGFYLSRLETAFGDTSPYPLAAYRSWSQVTGSMLAWGEGNGLIHHSSDLSFGVCTSYGMYVGVIWFRDRSFDGSRIPTAETRWPMANYCHMHKLPENECTEVNREKHGYNLTRECVILPVPVPGTWSCHS